MRTPICSRIRTAEHGIGFRPGFARAAAGLLLGASVCNSLAAELTPIEPQADNVVIEVLPAANRDEKLRVAARFASSSVADLLVAARRHLTIARTTGDPRELGRAQTQLTHPVLAGQREALLMLASISQSQHKFARARTELIELTNRFPAFTPALLMLANTYRVQGELASAWQTCEQAWSIQQTPDHAVCLADLAALRGQFPLADTWLRRTDRLSNGSTTVWRALVRAEIAVRRGDPVDAQRHFRRALVQPDVYVLDRYSQWLLDSGRPQAVVGLLNAYFPNDNVRPDAILLRLADAHQQLGNRAEFDRTAMQIRSRFDAASESGLPLTHLRERAQYALLIGQSPETALSLAQQNWQMQRESADAILLARAAIAASNQREIDKLHRYVARTGFSDTRLTHLLTGARS